MDISTLIGWVMAVGLVVWGIGFSKLGNFWDPQSLAIVLGGAIAALIASYPFRILKEVPKHILICFRGGKYNVPKLVDQLVDLAMLARQSGLLALEEKAEEIKDPFFKQSILKIVDANDPDKVREMLEKELDDMAARHDEGAGLYEKGSAYRYSGRSDQHAERHEPGRQQRSQQLRSGYVRGFDHYILRQRSGQCILSADS